MMLFGPGEQSYVYSMCGCEALPNVRMLIGCAREHEIACNRC